MTESDALGLVDSVNHHFHELYRKTQVYGDMDEDEEGELLCDIEFSLAYGGTYEFLWIIFNCVINHRNDVVE